MSIGKFLPEPIKYRLRPSANILNYLEKYLIYNINKIRGEEVVNTEYGFKMTIDRADFVQRRYMTNEGSGEDDFINFMHQKMLDSNVNGDFIDVGANVGFYSLMFCRLSSGNAYAFEPLSYNIDQISKNASLNNIQNLKIFPFGLSDQTYRSDIYYYPFNKGAGGEVRSENEPQALLQSEEVQFKNLDSISGISDNISLMKIDVEGHEIDVIRGAKQTLKDQQPEILIEVHPNQLDNKGQSVELLIKEVFDMGYEKYI